MFDFERNKRKVEEAIFKILASNKSISQALNIAPMVITQTNFKHLLSDYGFAYIMNHFCEKYSFELVDDLQTLMCETIKERTPVPTMKSASSKVASDWLTELHKPPQDMFEFWE
jgi:hypothetical protein